MGIDIVGREFIESVISDNNCNNEIIRNDNTKTQKSQNRESNNNSSNFDLEKWLKHYYPEILGPTRYKEGGRIWTFPDCIFRPGDGETLFLIQFSNGAISAGCQHNTCPGSKTTGNHWQEVKLILEGKGDRAKKIRRDTNPSMELDKVLSEFEKTEFGLSDRLIARYGAIMYHIEEWNDWIVFDGKRWVRSQCAAERLAQETILALLREAKCIEGKNGRPK